MPHVLIVDDDRATVRLLTMLLELDGYEVSQSPVPDTALEMARSRPVDAFVIDGHLVGASGLDLVRQIRLQEHLSGTKVVVTSGKDLAEQSQAAGADLFLLKPFSPTELSDGLRELLG